MILLTELSFERAAWWPLLGGAALLALGVFWALRRLRAAAEARYGAPPSAAPRSAAGRSLRIGMVALLLVLTGMDPRYGEERIEVARRGLDLILCLDTSRSMLARDVSPDRLSRARRDIVAVLPDLAGGDRVSLIAFAGEARLVCPPTHDVEAFRELLDQVDIATVPRGGSDLAAPLRRALELCEADREATTAVVLLTDGEDLEGKGRAAARDIAARGVVVHAVGYGSARGSKITLPTESGGEQFLVDQAGKEVVSALDIEGLRRLAEASGGEFLRADAVALPLVELHDKRIEPAQQRDFESGEDVVRQPRFQWVLLPALLLLLWELWAMGRARRT